jgi:hypothetical protein
MGPLLRDAEPGLGGGTTMSQASMISLFFGEGVSVDRRGRASQPVKATSSRLSSRVELTVEPPTVFCMR